MEKVKFERFISKYNLGGACESVILNVAGSALTTKSVGVDKNVLCEVSVDEDFGFAEGSYAVYNTAKLRSLLSVVGDTLKVNLVKEGKTPIAVTFDDGDTDITYALAEAAVIPQVPDLKKLPPFELAIDIDEQFTKTYVKARGALEVITFAVMSDGKKPEATVVLGHGNKNTNKVKIKVKTKEAAQLDAIEFSASYLREILVANKDAQNGKLEISSKGIARVTFSVDGIESKYYLIAIDTSE